MSTQIEDEDYELCIMRHGIAEDRRAGLADAKRALTPEGREGMRKIAEGLGKTGFAPVWVVSSPYVRAAETARIVVDSLGPKVPFDFCDALEPGGSPEELLTFLAAQAQRTRVLVVGHEPDLSALAARLTGAGRQANLGFKKGGCCLISFDEFPPQSPGRLVWWLTPRLLRKLA
ncbi:MAG TPA: phosphohistidine phosphatase SixA [Terriglobia bacterium]|nr:phosphohistidine phosphatase SixA [Terriglobia bacterium]